MDKGSLRRTWGSRGTRGIQFMIERVRVMPRNKDETEENKIFKEAERLKAQKNGSREKASARTD